MVLDERLKKMTERIRVQEREEIFNTFGDDELRVAARRAGIDITRIRELSDFELVEEVIDRVDAIPNIFCMTAKMEYPVADWEERVVRAENSDDARERFKRGEGKTIRVLTEDIQDIAPTFEHAAKTASVEKCRAIDVIRLFVQEDREK